jgi:hypothetical protein
MPWFRAMAGEPRHSSSDEAFRRTRRDRTSAKRDEKDSVEASRALDDVMSSSQTRAPPIGRPAQPRDRPHRRPEPEGGHDGFGGPCMRASIVSRVGSSMSTATSQPRRNRIGGPALGGQSPFARHPWALALIAAALIGGDEVLEAWRPPSDTIRRELVAAAAELASPVGPYPTDAATRAIRQHFRAHPATLQTKFWPQVSVTLQHLDRTTCVDAGTVARRMEGLVVVELKGYRSAKDCGDDNAMTWSILP